MIADEHHHQNGILVFGELMDLAIDAGQRKIGGLSPDRENRMLAVDARCKARLLTVRSQAKGREGQKSGTCKLHKALLKCNRVPYQ